MVKLLRDGFGVSLDEFEGGVAKATLTPYDTTPIYREMIDALHGMERDDRSEIIRHALWCASRVGASVLDERKSDTVPTHIHTSAPNVAQFPERTVPRWTPEFPIDPIDFNDSGDTDFPLELHSFEQEDWEGPGVDAIADMTTTKLLSSREVRSAKLRTVRVRGNDVAPFRDGWKLAIDVTKQDPSIIPDKKAIVAYRKDKGAILGRLYHVGARAILKKDNDESGIDLSDGYRIIGALDHIAYSTDEGEDETTAKRNAK